MANFTFTPRECHICREGNIASRHIWLLHLTQDEHQRKSQALCHKWGKNERESVLVGFCEFPVTHKSFEVLQFMNQGNTVVTDFIWSRQYPKIGIFRFENRAVVECILGPLRTSTKMFVECQLVEFRQASTILDMEWNALLPELSETDTDKSLPEYESEETETWKRRLSEDENTNTTMTQERSFEESVTVKRTKLQCYLTKRAEENKLNVMIDLSPMRAGEQPSITSLKKQFLAIQRFMTIPNEEFGVLVNLVNALHEMFVPVQPNFNACLFRRHFLKIRDPIDIDQNEALIFCSNVGGKDGPNVSIYQLERGILQTREGRRLIPGVTKKVSTPGVVTVQDIDFGKGWTLELIRPSDNFQVRLVGTPPFIMESQLCKLLQYMCAFDPRCIPLLALVRYWAKVNNVRLGESHIKPLITSCCIPAPASLDWMVITFLVSQGILPSPRTILATDHKPIWAKLSLNPLNDKMTDLGFFPDPLFTYEWKKSKSRSGDLPEEKTDAFFLSVITLAQQFFEDFGSKFKADRWLLNTRDGQLIRLDAFLPGQSHHIPKGLTRQEIQHIKNKQTRGGYLQVVFTRQDETPLTSLHVVNPFDVVSSLHVNNENPREFQRIAGMIENAGKSLKALLSTVYTQEIASFNLTQSFRSKSRKKQAAK